MHNVTLRILMQGFRWVTFCFLTSLLVLGCQTQDNYLFELIPEDDTNISFSNDIIESDSFNIVLYEYIYNGGGVGVGDFNRDGSPDLVFSGNRVSSALYIQESSFEFRDVTIESGLQTGIWCAGVSIIDVNQDGWDDIYFSTLCPDGRTRVPNLLFVNQGIDSTSKIPQFIEMAHRYGLDDSSYCTQSAWLDFDLDGDLDVYLLNNAIEGYNRNTPKGTDRTGQAKSVDRLYRKDGDHFTNVTDSMGIDTEGWGLGVAIHDINSDGYPDVYAANDFLSNDLLWINQKGQRFENKIQDYLAHQSYNSMGMDIADINNDALSEILVLDMLPDDNERRKRMFSMVNNNRYQLNIQKEYQPQFVRNTLQYNQGCSLYSDISYMAGIAATDWSWAPLMADLDNDGFKDIFITNGYPKDITDLDFLKYRESKSGFGTDQSRLETVMKDLEKVDGVYQSNYFFRNTGGLIFEDVSDTWSQASLSYSNGAVFTDLDMDGDLDIVVNNINQPAYVYKNNSIETKPGLSHFLKVNLIGPSTNSKGIGSKVYIYMSDGSVQFHEQYLTRGYLSSVDDQIHFGLGKEVSIDSMKVVWPDGTSEIRMNIRVDTVLEFDSSHKTQIHPVNDQQSSFFKNISDQASGAGWKNQPEVPFKDYNHHRLWMRVYSQEGPVIASGDFDRNGYDDLVIGGSSGQVSRVLYFDPNAPKPFHVDSLSFLASQVCETTAIEIFDANGDDFPDIYFGHGSSEFSDQSPYFRDYLYINSGDYQFDLDMDALPPDLVYTGTIASGDVDKDGDQDLFVGGRMLVDSFPFPPKSMIYINEKGKFTNRINKYAPGLNRSGMITSADWADVDRDGWPDLIIAGEFMPVSVWKNQKGQFLRQDQKILPEMGGWWQNLSVFDYDHDGDMDILTGNIGMNGPMKASKDHPVCIRAADYDKNGSIDPVYTAYLGAVSYPVHPRGTILGQIPYWASLIPNYSSYAGWSEKDLPPLPADGITICADEFRSILLVNDDRGQFSIHALPAEAQISPLTSFAWLDYDRDGDLDLVGVGNDYGYEILGGRYDAGVGITMKNNATSDFKPVHVSESGFSVSGDSRDIVVLKNRFDNRVLIVVSVQDQPFEIFELLK